MKLRDQLINNSNLRFNNNVFEQVIIPFNQTDFEQNYLSLRSAEGRHYSDSFVSALPYVPDQHAEKNEWMVRLNSMVQLQSFINKERRETNFILEVGCGNGWLSHHLCKLPGAEVCSMDINKTELAQASRVFSVDPNLSLIHGDVFTLDFENLRFDTVVLAGSIQYFPDVPLILKRLIQILAPGGKIHIIDSPIYKNDEEAFAAKQRSASHFEATQNKLMSDYYFHHQWKDMSEFNWEILYNPRSLRSKLQRLITPDAMRIFPWIVIQQ